MPNSPMRDLIVLLPGIGGSVLQKGGKKIWAGSSVFTVTAEPHEGFEYLTLEGDDPQGGNVDGVEAPLLVPDIHMVPGLWKLDNYSAIRRVIENNFAVTPGTVDIDDDGRANYFELPYDWRRDNRATAHRLRAFVNDRLEKWRRRSGAADAKVILIAHSMGGLAARYYLEVLGGWRKCRLLVTLGTPHRGTVRALNYIVNGYKQLPPSVIQIARSFTSVYQLLPFYKSVKTGDKYHRVPVFADLEGVDRGRAKDARKFHMEIKNAVALNSRESEYQDKFQVVTIVGIHQPTFLSAELHGRRLEAHLYPPTKIAGEPNSGDGIVPYPSAIPFGTALDDFQGPWFIERNSCLQNNADVLDCLWKSIRATQGEGSGGADGKEQHRAPYVERTGISLEVEDLYFVEEPVALNAKIVNQRGHLGGLKAAVRSAGGHSTAAGGSGVISVNGLPDDVRQEGSAISFEAAFRQEGDGWSLVVEGLRQGLYRLEVSANGGGGEKPSPVHDLFQIVRRS